MGYARARGSERAAVYAVHCRGFVKIGITHDPTKRLKSMQGGCPFPLELLAAWEVSADSAVVAERSAMVALTDTHHEGEWFKCSKPAALYALGAAATKVGGKPWEDRPKAVYAPPQHAVITPKGEFPNLKEAASAFGISRQAAWSKARRQVPGWKYIGETNPPPPRGKPGRPRKKNSIDRKIPIDERH